MSSAGLAQLVDSTLFFPLTTFVPGTRIQSNLTTPKDRIYTINLHTVCRCAATVSVVTNDGRHIVGILRGYDQATNLILDETFERIYREDEATQTIALGLYVVRGDGMCVC